MKVVVQAGELARALGHVRGVVPARATMPILMHVLVKAAEGSIEVRGTSLDMEAASSVDADVQTDGAVAVPGDVLLGIVKRWDKTAPVTLTLEGAAGTDDGRVVVSSGRSRYQLRTLPADEFPVMPTLDDAVSFDLPCSTVASLFEMTAYATGDDVDRSYLGGVYLHRDGARIAAVASDGLRLARIEIERPEPAAGMPNAIVPRSAVRQIVALLADSEGSVTLAVSPTRLSARAGRAQIITQLLAGDYIAYKDFIPTDAPTVATVRPAALVAALDRAFCVYAGTDVKTPVARFRSGAGGLSFDTRSGQGDAGCEDVAAEVHAENVSFSLNVRYLTEALKVMPDEDTDVLVTGGMKPVLFRPRARPDLLHLLMPLKF